MNYILYDDDTNKISLKQFIPPKMKKSATSVSDNDYNTDDGEKELSSARCIQMRSKTRSMSKASTVCHIYQV